MLKDKTETDEILNDVGSFLVEYGGPDTSNVVVHTSSQKTNKVFTTNISWKDDISVRGIVSVIASRAILRVRNLFVRTRHKINCTRYEDTLEKVRLR